MDQRSMLLIVAVIGLASPAMASETSFAVDPSLGNSVVSAVFDSAIGERITAVSSAIGCTLTVDESSLEGRAHCSVPLTSVRVDNDDTKSEHFAEWATNKKSEPATCTLEVDVPAVKLPATPKEKTPLQFTTEGTFVICGRKRDDGGREKIATTLTYLPAGTYGEKRTLRIRARIEKFDRERYGVSPKNTSGWLSRVQQLAPVVAAEGTIDVSAFATTADAAEPKPAH